MDEYYFQKITGRKIDAKEVNIIFIYEKIVEKVG